MTPAGGRNLRRWAHAARVAGVAASVMAVLYVAATVPFDVIDSHRLLRQVDRDLADRLGDLARVGTLPLTLSHDSDLDHAPIFVWQVSPSGTASALDLGAPALAPGSWPRPGQSKTVPIGKDQFRLRTGATGATLFVVGESLAETNRVVAVIDRAEVIAGPIFVVAMFFGALAIGALASRPVETARRRQVEFVADASHELRTPLTVIEAEVGLALSAERDKTGYRAALECIGTESKRLRRIVEDMLFLARFDATPPPPGDEPVDLVTVAQACAMRFGAVARAREVEISFSTNGVDAALIKAPPEWVDRLCGVLVDNACRFAGNGGRVRVMVEARGATVSLVVEDSGPGIAPEERPHLFDRFHQGNEGTEGAGLGLAIADAVVRATGGRWRVGSASIGGASMGVLWHRSQLRDVPVGQGRPRPARRPGGPAERAVS
jgi:two-component system sensor histidine kinase CiaH